MNNDLKTKLRKYNNIFQGIFLAAMFISFILIVIPYNWYLENDSFILKKFNKIIALTYKCDDNINKINSFYYRYIFPFFCILIGIVSIGIYKIECRIDKIRYKGIHNNTINLSPNIRIRMIDVSPLLFVAFICWIYFGEASYEQSSLAIMRVADSTIFGFALLNTSASIFLMALCFSSVTCIYDYFLYKRSKK